MKPPKIQRDVRGNTDLYKLCCAHYHHFNIYACRGIILSYTTSFISLMFLWVITSLDPLQVFGIYLTRFNKFRKFWPSYFVDPSVRVTDNFCKVHRMIDRFNESRKNIALGVGKTADESMSAIRFCTTPKGYLPHYYFIFRNTEPLGTEMKNVACSILRTMLHIEIQNGKEAMKTSKFQKYIGGTAACMKRLAIDTEGCGQLTSNDS